MAWRIREGVDPGYTLYDVADRLRNRGWQVPAYPLTGSVSDISVQRILVRQGVSRDMATLLLDDIKLAIEHFAEHPVTVLHDQGGVRRLQPPVGGVGASGPGDAPATLAAAGTGRPVHADLAPAQEPGLADLRRAVGRPRR